jgi:hypothetical protein
MTTTLTYSQIQENIELFNMMKIKLSNMRCDCWAVFKLEIFDLETLSRKPTYYHLRDYSTEQECLDYIDRLVNLDGRCKDLNFVVLPISKNSMGEIYVANKLTKCAIKEYIGPCKVWLSHKNGTNKWFEAKAINVPIAHGEPAYAEMVETKPTDWKNIKYDYKDLVPKWAESI